MTQSGLLRHTVLQWYSSVTGRPDTYQGDDRQCGGRKGHTTQQKYRYHHQPESCPPEHPATSQTPVQFVDRQSAGPDRFLPVIQTGLSGCRSGMRRFRRVLCWSSIWRQLRSIQRVSASGANRFIPISPMRRRRGPVFFVDAVVVFHLTLPRLMACDSSPRRCP